MTGFQCTAIFSLKTCFDDTCAHGASFYFGEFRLVVCARCSGQKLCRRPSRANLGRDLPGVASAGGVGRGRRVERYPPAATMCDGGETRVVAAAHARHSLGDVYAYVHQTHTHAPNAYTRTRGTHVHIRVFVHRVRTRIRHVRVVLVANVHAVARASPSRSVVGGTSPRALHTRRGYTTHVARWPVHTYARPTCTAYYGCGDGHGRPFLRALAPHAATTCCTSTRATEHTKKNRKHARARNTNTYRTQARARTASGVTLTATVSLWQVL